MASTAQLIANAANAQHSTGPRTEEGKAKTARNAETNGFTTGVLAIKPEHRVEFAAFEAALIADMEPTGALEMDAMREFRDAAWRLRQIRAVTRQLFDQHNEDPCTHPETVAAMRQLTRYRAAAEMQLHRSINVLRDLQTIRLGRVAHLMEFEQDDIGPLADPKVFAVMEVAGYSMNRSARERHDCFHNEAETSGKQPAGPICENEANSGT